jgi:hypothetical protein
MKTIGGWLGLVAIALAGCPSEPVAPPPPVPVDGGAPVDAAAAACMRLRELGCPEGDGVAGGQSCEAVMRHVASTGRFAIDVECIAFADNIQQIRTCGSIRCQR